MACCTGLSMHSPVVTFLWLFLAAESVTFGVSEIQPQQGNCAASSSDGPSENYCVASSENEAPDEVSLLNVAQMGSHQSVIEKRKPILKEKDKKENHSLSQTDAQWSWRRRRATPTTTTTTTMEARAEARQVADVEWNWVLIKLNSASNLPADHTYFGMVSHGVVDVKVKANAWSSQGGSYDGGLGTKLSEVVWAEQKGTAHPIWDHIGLVAFKKGSASHVELRMWDVDYDADDVLISTKIPIPSKTDSWGAEQEVQGPGGSKLRLQMRFCDGPIVSKQEQEDMNQKLEEKIFSLTTGDSRQGADKASLAYKKAAGNTKAILYIPGRGDSFMHPHVLKLFLDNA